MSAASKNSATKNARIAKAKAAAALDGAGENVFLFIPNLVGYARVVLAALSLYYMPIHPRTCMVLYSISCLLDAVDGQAARYYDQCSKFGAVLDMVTDRCTTACLLCYLASAYSNYAIVFQFLIALDVSSHYMHMYSSLTSGATSHKKISETSNFILRAYYSNNNVLFAFCFANELFFVLLYLFQFDVLNTYVFWALALATGPICFGKQVINCIQFANAAKSLAHQDVIDRKLAGKSQ